MGSKTIKTLVVLIVILIICIVFRQDKSKNIESQKITALFKQQKSKKTKKRILNWMGQWESHGLRETLVKEIAKDYTFKNPDVVVNLKFAREIMGVKNKRVAAQYIVDMIRNKDYRFDVIWLDLRIYYFVAEKLGDLEWSKKHLVDLEKQPGFAASHKDFIINENKYREITGGIHVSPWLEGYLFALWSNKELAAKIGIDVKQREMTFDDFVGYIKKANEYKKRTGESFAIVWETKDWFSIRALFDQFVFSNLDSYEEIVTLKRTKKKEKAFLKALEAFGKLSKYSLLNKDHNEVTWFNTRHRPLENKALFYFSGTWVYSLWSSFGREKMEKMVPCEIPVLKKSDTAIGGYVPTWAVLKNAPNKDLGIQLLMSICKPKIAEKWVRYTKNPTGIKGNISKAGLAQKQDIWTKFQADMSKKYKSRLFRPSNTAYLFGEKNANLKEQLDDMLREILMGKKTAKQVYENIMEILK